MALPSSLTNFPHDGLPSEMLPKLLSKPVSAELFYQISNLQSKYVVYLDSGIYSSDAFLQIFTPDISANYQPPLGDIQGVDNLRRIIEESNSFSGSSQHAISTHVMGQQEDEGIWCLTYTNVHHWMRGEDSKWLDVFGQYQDFLVKDKKTGEYRIKFRHTRYCGPFRGPLLEASQELLRK